MPIPMVPVTCHGVSIDLANETDLEAVLALQTANQISNGGHLSALVPRARLTAMMAVMPLLVARRDHDVVGFLMTHALDMGADIPIVRAMLEAYPRHRPDAYVYGPVCVAPLERGKGIAPAMFGVLKGLLPGRQGVLFIRRDNESSIRAHRAMGMREVARFHFGDVEHVVMTY